MIFFFVVSIFTKLQEHTETICMIVQIKYNIQIQFLKHII